MSLLQGLSEQLFPAFMNFQFLRPLFAKLPFKAFSTFQTPKPASKPPQPQPNSKRKQTQTQRNSTITNREVVPIATTHNHK